MLAHELPKLSVDIMDPVYTRDPYPFLEPLRDKAPAYYWEMGRGPVFMRWADVSSLMRDSRLGLDPTFGHGLPAEMKAAFPDFAALREHDLFSVPAPAHARMRKLLNPVFGPKAVEVHRPKIEHIIGSMLDAMPDDGVVNVSGDFARKYPVRVIASILNIPEGHDAEFVAFADALISTIIPGLPPEVFAALMPAISRGMAIVREVIKERRAHPLENDLTTQLIQACDNDERLSEEELLSLVSGLIIGGSDTTTHLTGRVMLQLHRHPEQLAILRQDLSLARNTLDETLRFDSFGRAFLPRYALETFTQNDVVLPQGSVLFLAMSTAFRDLEFAPDANVYDIRRKHTGAPWFGFGPHFCLGASLARLEAERAVQMFFTKFPHTELAGEPEYGNHAIMRDLANLPIRVRTTA
ncbi:MAG TPA: cytochrome P450 [Polyangium sp.]|nr:cytochrome P450 [Polyangium sp.]